MKFSKMAITLGLVSAFAAGSVQANDNKNTGFPLFVGGETLKAENQATDRIELSIPRSWTVTSTVPRRVCMQWEGEVIRSNPEPKVELVEKGDTIEGPRRRCIEWETINTTVSHGKATRYPSYNYSSRKQVVVLQPYYFSMDGESLDTNTFYNRLNSYSLAYRLRRDGYNVVLYEYKDMNAGIEAAATGTKALIKELSDSTYVDSISVVGLSMGGVVGRYALTQMAYEGVDSKVSVFVSYDAPHTGANIPKSVLDNVRRLEDKVDVPFCGEISECSKARRQLRAILAQMDTRTFKQLVIDAPNAGTLRTDLINRVNAWGGRPSVPSFVISNGSSSQRPGVPHNKMVTHFKLHRPWYVGGSKYFKVYTNAARDNVSGGLAGFYTVFSDTVRFMPHPITPYVTLAQDHSFVSTSSAMAGSSSYWNSVSYAPTNEQHMHVSSSRANEIFNLLGTYQN